MSDPEKPRSPFEGSLQFDTEAWHRAGCPTLESAFVAWQAAEERANTAEAELRETAGELDAKHAKLVEVADKLRVLRERVETWANEQIAHPDSCMSDDLARGLLEALR